jgi:Raf kinase inhibitor-like YbhB/YbcL family protein
MKRYKKLIVINLSLIIISMVLLGNGFVVSAPQKSNEDANSKGNTPLSLTSPAFKDNGDIPILYTGEGKDVSPALLWANVPPGTRTLALICDDPDAPHGTWIHWILYNISPTLSGIAEGGTNLTREVLVGVNSNGKLGYNGPKPPYGTHHYRFTLYALDTVLPLEGGTTRAELDQAMQGHVLAQVTLTGLYHSHNHQ